MKYIKIFLCLMLLIVFPKFVYAQEGILNIDYPVVNSQYGDQLYVQGWFVSNESDVSISISIDNVEFIKNSSRYERNDVLDTISGYDASINLLPGYREYLSIDALSEGNHVVSVSVYDKHGILIHYATRNFRINRTSLIGCIDYPSSEIYGDSIFFQGWIMSSLKNVLTDVYIDKTKVDLDLTRYKRDDVMRVISGYSDKYINPTPGFATEISLDGYLDGTHYIEIIFKNSKNEVLYTMKKSFVIKRNIAKIYLDSPTSEVNGNLLNIYGWVMSTSSNFDIKAYIDNSDINFVYKKYKRDDVRRVIKNYGSMFNNLEPGFIGNYDVGSYSDGIHTLRVDVLSSDGNVISSDSISFNLVKYVGLSYIDSPIVNSTIEGTILLVKGWTISSDMNDYIYVYLDDNRIEIDVDRYGRKDVNDVYPVSYGGISSNPNPGFSVNIDVSSYIDGIHQLKVCVVANDGNNILHCTSKNIKIKKYKSLMVLDSPTENESINSTTLTLCGWLMSSDKNVSIKLYFDADDVTEGIIRYTRQDVLNVYPNSYGGVFINSNPGYKNVIDVSQYLDGYHTIKLRAISSITNEVLYQIDKKIYLKKNKSLLNLDYPIKYNFSNDTLLTIQGWELSDFNNSKVKIFLDSIELSVSRVQRNDVISAYPNMYGGEQMNNLPGFSTNYNLSSLSSGEHLVKVYIYNYLNEVVNSDIRKIYVYDNIYFGIDVSSHQNKIDWGLVSKAGIDFAILRVGYGDNWKSQDDVQFLNNVNGVTNCHIPFGVYIYSYATNLHGASGLNDNSASIDSEIAHTLRLLNSISSEQKKYFKLPVFIDMEDDSTKYIGKSRLTQFADYFCGAIEQNGYKCGVYANKNWLTTYLDSKYLVDKYDIWLAHYTDGYYDTSDYTGKYHIWQYSSTGHLSGVNSSYLDMDISYKKYW